MPSFQGRLREEEILQLIAYIRSLSAAPPSRDTLAAGAASPRP